MRQCEICGKGSIVRGGRKKLRGKYNPTPKKRKYPNLQKTRLPKELPPYLRGRGFAPGQRILACAQCIKTATKRPQPEH